MVMHSPGAPLLSVHHTALLRLRVALMPALLVLLAACQSAPPMSDAVHWYRNSAEMRAAYEQTFRAAESQLRVQTRDLPRGSWAVIMDVDETLLDNSGYVVEFGRYTPPTWDEWTARQSARALPGAVRFTTVVREELGGRVALVTNREQKSCADTQANLRREGIGHDLILCMTDTADKNPRFAAVQAGTAGHPPLQVLMWLGDNIEDFPGLSQADGAAGEFGSRYFVLPNPYYGSWEQQPRQ